SNKLDQPNGGYSYYGALGASEHIINDSIKSIEEINKQIKTKNEMHFLEYTSDTNFVKYFKTLNEIINQDISINIMIVNNEHAKKIADRMAVTMTQLRELLYVKLPERHLYGMVRELKMGARVQITIDENDEYGKLELQTKLAEQMNAHSAYRNKGYKINNVRQSSSEMSIPLQIIDTYMGMVIFIIEKQYKGIYTKGENITLKIKFDLIYLFLIHNKNLDMFQSKINLYKWEDNDHEIAKVNLSDYISEFVVHKTQFDIQEMNRLERLRLENPGKPTKFYREKMGYANRQLKTIQGYLDELNGLGRNSYYDEH